MATDVVDDGIGKFKYVCDTEGFYQHYGECWLDAFVMLFLFADGIKEITQPAVYNTPIEALDTSEVPGGDEIKSRVLEFAQNLRERFIRHYWNQTVREKTNLRLTETKRAKGEQAIRLASIGRCLDSPLSVVPNKEAYIAGTKGGHYKQVEKMFYMMIKLYKLTTKLFVDDTYSIKREPHGRIKEENSVDPITYINITHHIRALWIDAIRQNYAHAIAFYECNHNQYVYEDNYGPILFPWRSLLNAMAERQKMKEEWRLGFIDSAIVPDICIDYRYLWLPIMYAYIPQPDGTFNVHIATVCSSGAIMGKTITTDIENKIYKLQNIVLFRTFVKPQPAEMPLPFTQRYFPRKLQKVPLQDATGQGMPPIGREITRVPPPIVSTPPNVNKVLKTLNNIFPSSSRQGGARRRTRHRHRSKRRTRKH
jgi:hypothetical protein